MAADDRVDGACTVADHELRASPAEWHRRGMLHPADVEALVHRRLAENLPHDPVYADFFGPVSRPREPER